MVTTQKKRCNGNYGGCRDSNQRSLFDAKRRKEQALTNHETNRKAILLKARHVFIQHLLQSGESTADHIREVIELPPDINPSCLGAVPAPLARAGIVQRGGYVVSRRKESHARTLSLWQLLDRAKAQQWLDDNPLPQPEGESSE